MAPKNNKMNRQKIKICSINIDGLGEKSRFSLDKYQYDEDFDVIAVQETRKDNADAIPLCNMSTIIDSNLAINSGAALYVHTRHNITKIEEISRNCKNIDSCWGLVVLNGARFILGSVYVKRGVKTGISDVISMLDIAHHLCSKLKAKGVILLGDFNARNQIWGDHTSDENGRKLFKELDSTRFTIMTPKTPTFLCKSQGTNGSSFIDLAIISNNISNTINNIETDTEIELWSGAPSRGHVPVIFTMDGDSNQSIPTVKKLSIKNINWDEWASDIEQEVVNNETAIYSEDPKMLLKVIEELFDNATVKHGKMKTISCHSKPYWNDKLSRLSKQLRVDRKNFTFRNTDRNRDKFLKSKADFDEERKRACQEFILTKTKNLNAVESNKFWKEFKKITCRKTNQKICPLEDGKGGIITECEEMEELLFTTFFQCEHMNNVSFDDDFYRETNTQYDAIMQQEGHSDSVDSEDLNMPITEEEIRKTIKSVKSSGKSVDNHGLHPEMLKKIGPKFLGLILILFNLCLQLKIWVWENAEVIFLKKEGKKSYSIPGSYRPISITSYLGKLLERILAVRANKFLRKMNIFDPFQEGFTEKKNTIRYLNRLILDIKNDLHNRKTVLCLFLDFEKAFDSVWKKGLIVKLFRLGFNGNFLKLVDHFLNSRNVSLNVNGNKGDTRPCSEYGLPQGSVMSPILFKIFMLDFLSDLNEDNTNIYKFADDGSVKISGDTTAECLAQLEKVLEALNTWAKKWRMVINCQPNKTEVICFGTAENNRNLIPTEFKLGSQTIKLVKHTKVLGITIDEDLSFIEHSKQVYKKLTTRWNMIQMYCNRNWGFSQRVMVELTRTLFLSCLLYGSHLWMNKNNMKEINSLYYKLLKTSIGSVFNTRQSIIEIIVGLPPINIQNKMNQIKHYLKIIMNDVPDDPLKQCIQQITQNNPPIELQITLRSVYKFLNWKIQQTPNKFLDSDKQIIEENRISSFHLLSPNCAEYTKLEVNKYTEILWADSVRNEFQFDGHSTIPHPRCSQLPLDPKLGRNTEVKIISLFYENNLLNSFLHRHNIPGVDSPLCACGKEEQTAHHFLMRCDLVAANLREKVCDYLHNAGVLVENSVGLLNLSRNENFMNTIVDIMKAHGDILRNDIILS